mmetsp:Transcript_60740/g.177442  ORF Transcript_60740/g.177442 Transcript_60740/m.177442 type:complete len:287 (+) Transcript_60740:1557-2417(+)
MKAEDWPLHVAPHLLNSQELEDSHLDLLQAAMVLVQHRPRLADGEGVLRALLPRQGGEELEVGVSGGVLRVVRLDALQSPQLPFGDLGCILREPHLGELLSQADRLVHLLLLLPVALAFLSLSFLLRLRPHPLQVLLHLLNLARQDHLAELHLPGLLDVGADLARHALGLRLPLEEVQQVLKALPNVKRLQDPLALLDGELHERGPHDARERGGGRGPTELLALAAQQLGGGVLPALHQLSHLFLDAVHERPDAHVALLGLGPLLEQLDLGQPDRRALHDLQQPEA